MRIKVILQNYNTTHTKYQELLSAMLKEQRGERMDEEFIRNRITELRLKKGVSEYQMSMELGQNRSYIQAISSGRSMPSMKQFLNICEYFEITPLQFFDAQENNPQLIKKALDGMRKMSDDDLIMLWCCTIKVDIENSKGQYIEKDKQEATKDGSESTKIQHGI